MAHNYQSSLSPWRVFTSAVRPVTSLALTLGWAIAAMPNAQATSVSAPTATSSTQPSQRLTAQAASVASNSLANGVYLYGESAEPEQIGSAYMVFEVKEGKVMGAFYMPRSSFDCFSGAFQANKLALNVVDTYEQSVHPYAIALERPGNVASSSQNSALPAIGLEGFQRLDKLSDNDQRILGVCQASFKRNPAGK